MDQERDIAARVQAALDSRTPLSIHGGHSKDFYGHPVAGEALDLSGHRGVVDYEPGELVITCRAGTPLNEIRKLLAENGQHLPFEPPGYGESATIGGTVACGLSGPRRPWAGSLRDYLLGVKLVNGAGQVVRFGGRVMKNVAGYDIPRLMAGSLGTLGVILEASFKVLPLPASERTLRFECGQDEAIRRVNGWSGKPLPLSGAAWQQGELLVRVSGAAPETARAARVMGGDDAGDSDYWQRLREHQLPFFEGAEPLWRVSLAPATPPLDLPGECLIDWGGAQRWYRTSLEATSLREQATAHRGHAVLFRGDTDSSRFQPLPSVLRALHQRVKRAMDPHGLFNPGRMGPDF